MLEIDEFASQLLEESKRFLELAKERTGKETAPFLHASLLLAFCALEAHTNAVSDEFVERPDVSPHVAAVLRERDLRLEDGAFVIDKKRLKIYRLEDRLLVLHRLGPKPDLDGAWRAALGSAIELRNRLTHPKAAVADVNTVSVTRALQAVIDTLDALYLAVYKKRFPAAHRQLHSKLNF